MLRANALVRFAQRWGDEQTREHLVSQSLWEGHGLAVIGLPWCKDEPKRWSWVPDIKDSVPPPQQQPVSLRRSWRRRLRRSATGNRAGNERAKLRPRNGVKGQQLEAGPAGRIDLLTTDPGNGLLVIGLKAGEADRQACAQIQAYMAWVMDTLNDGKPGRGVLVAGGFTERCKLAAKVVPGLSLKRYSVTFSFREP